MLKELKEAREKTIKEIEEKISAVVGEEADVSVDLSNDFEKVAAAVMFATAEGVAELEFLVERGKSPTFSSVGVNHIGKNYIQGSIAVPVSVPLTTLMEVFKLLLDVISATEESTEKDAAGTKEE